jgi:hypothetical protein
MRKMSLEIQMETELSADEIRELLSNPNMTLTMGAGPGATVQVSESSAYLERPLSEQLGETGPAREEVDELMAEFAFTEWEQRDVLRDFVVVQSMTSSPGILRRLQEYVRANYSDGEEVQE